MFVGLLSEAQPYIEKYRSKVMVVKYGGNAMVSDELKRAVMKDLITLNMIGIKVVLVHGGGPDINKQLELMGKEPEFVGGLRKTDDETMEAVQQVLAGKVNKNLVAMLEGYGVGLCGMDGEMLLCEKKKTETDLGHVGEIVSVNVKLIKYLLENSFIPVIATVGMDKSGIAYNINADTAACKIAIALGAEKIISMTDVAGLLSDKDDESTLIDEVEIAQVDNFIKSGVIQGGMIPKIKGCVECVEAGVAEAVIIDGRKPHSLFMEIFSDKGCGTLFYKKLRRQMNEKG